MTEFVPSPEQLAETELTFVFRVSPVRNVICDLSGMLGNFSDDVLRAFYSRRVAARANIAITELVNNVIENFADPLGATSLELTVRDQVLFIDIGGPATEAQYAAVRGRVDWIYSADDPHELLKQTIRERRKQRLPGGLGLLRLVTENKFALDVRYADGVMHVEATLQMRGVQ
jgi:hypothetical protein